MKTIIIFFSLLQVINFQAENYYIIKIKGAIYNETAGKMLQQGDAVQASDKLIFKQKDAMAMVISDYRGRFTLKYPTEKENDNDALFVFVKAALTINKQNQLSTRALGISTTVRNLEDYFGAGVFNIIGDTLQIKLSSKSYPLSKYDIVALYNNKQQSVAKKLNQSHQLITLSRKSFDLKSNGEVYIPNIHVFKVNIQSGSKSLLCKTGFRFIDKEQLNREFNIIIDQFYNENKSEIQSLLTDYFLDTYGKTDTHILSEYIHQLINKHTVQ